MLRLAIFFSLFAAIGSGAWATFRDPTPENAANIMNPTPDQIAEAQSWVTPFFDWMTGITPDSLSQLIRDAIADVKASLGDEPIIPPPPGGAASSFEGPQRMRVQRAPAPSPAGSTGTAPGGQAPAQQPGIDWYRDSK